jgi:DNA polymerase V
MSINIFNPNQTSELVLRNVGTQISAGFPSPMEDYLEAMLDLNRELIKNPSSTFYGQV